MVQPRLYRPLTFFDVETTGLDTRKDAIIEIAMVRLEPSGEVTTYESYVNPGREVPGRILGMTRISQSSIDAAPPLRDIAPDILPFFTGCDVGGYNVANFDWPILDRCMREVGHSIPSMPDRRFIDPMWLLKTNESRNLTWAYSFYLDKSRASSHRAMRDTEDTVEIFLKQLEVYVMSGNVRDFEHDSLGKYLDFDQWFRRDYDGYVVFNKGKNHKGRRLSDVMATDTSFIDWMLGLPDLHPTTRRVIDGLRAKDAG